MLFKKFGISVAVLVCIGLVLLLAFQIMDRPAFPERFARVDEPSRREDLRDYFIGEPLCSPEQNILVSLTREGLIQTGPIYVTRYLLEWLFANDYPDFGKVVEYPEINFPSPETLLPGLDGGVTHYEVLCRKKERMWLSLSTEDYDGGEYVLEAYFDDSNPRYILHKVGRFTAAAVDTDRRVVFLFRRNGYYEAYDLESKTYVSRQSAAGLEDRYVSSALFDKYQNVIVTRDEVGLHYLRDGRLNLVNAGETYSHEATPQGLFYLHYGKLWRYDYATDENELLYAPTRVPLVMPEYEGYLEISYDDSMLLYVYGFNFFGDVRAGLFVIDFETKEFAAYPARR